MEEKTSLELNQPDGPLEQSCNITCPDTDSSLSAAAAGIVIVIIIIAIGGVLILLYMGKLSIKPKGGTHTHKKSMNKRSSTWTTSKDPTTGKTKVTWEVGDLKELEELSVDPTAIELEQDADAEGNIRDSQLLDNTTTVVGTDVFGNLLTKENMGGDNNMEGARRISLMDPDEFSINSDLEDAVGNIVVKKQGNEFPAGGGPSPIDLINLTKTRNSMSSDYPFHSFAPQQPLEYYSISKANWMLCSIATEAQDKNHQSNSSISLSLFFMGGGRRTHVPYPQVRVPLRYGEYCDVYLEAVDAKREVKLSGWDGPYKVVSRLGRDRGYVVEKVTDIELSSSYSTSAEEGGLDGGNSKLDVDNFSVNSDLPSEDDRDDTGRAAAKAALAKLTQGGSDGKNIHNSRMTVSDTIKVRRHYRGGDRVIFMLAGGKWGKGTVMAVQKNVAVEKKLDKVAMLLEKQQKEEEYGNTRFGPGAGGRGNYGRMNSTASVQSTMTAASRVSIPVEGDINTMKTGYGGGAGSSVSPRNLNSARQSENLGGASSNLNSTTTTNTIATRKTANFQSQIFGVVKRVSMMGGNNSLNTARSSNVGGDIFPNNRESTVNSSTSPRRPSLGARVIAKISSSATGTTPRVPWSARLPAASGQNSKSKGKKNNIVKASENEDPNTTFLPKDAEGQPGQEESAFPIQGMMGPLVKIKKDKTEKIFTASYLNCLLPEKIAENPERISRVHVNVNANNESNDLNPQEGSESNSPYSPGPPPDVAIDFKDAKEGAGL